MEQTPKYRVAYATGSRADYGIVRQYLAKLNEDRDVELEILVTGSHLHEKYGMTVNNIKADGFKIGYTAKIDIDTSNNAGVLTSMSDVIKMFGSYFEQNKYELLIILGDRYEMMAVAISAAMHGIPILHLHGGEITYGNYDEFIRHSITKMSKYHFTSTEIYRNRVIQLGEHPDRVFNLGALGAENCKSINGSLVDQKVKKLEDKNYFVVAFHPETLTGVDLSYQVEQVLEAISSFPEAMDYVFLGTNADTNSHIIRDKWKQYAEDHTNITYIENLNTDSYLYMLKNSAALIGNSSSGIIEAPSLGIYTINIGNRQTGRVYGNSVLNVACEKDTICDAMKLVYKRSKLQEGFDNPYYKENTSELYYAKTKELLEEGNHTIKEFYDI